MYSQEFLMSTTLHRHLHRFYRSLRTLAAGLYAAHGGWDEAHAARMASFTVTRG